MNYKYKKNYSTYSYWEKKIIDDEPIWLGNFNNENITKDSVILYTGMFNEEKDIYEYGWVAYPNIYTALGFITNVFVPTATVTWHKKNVQGLLVPIEDYEDVLDSLIEENEEEISEINKARDIYNKLEELWDCSDKDIIREKIDILIDRCNDLWEEQHNKKIFIKVFHDIDEIVPFIRETIGWDELIEEETSMSIEKLEYITEENVLSDELLNRVLMELLNNNMPVLF